jgi:ABC-type Fe3+/spermidine/putrescine transport system ATPase subunit
MALITISGLSKSFGEVVAVDTVTMEIEEGSFTSFLDPLGRGKITMLRMIAGVEDPDPGEIRVVNLTMFSHFKRLVPQQKRDKWAWFFSRVSKRC